MAEMTPADLNAVVNRDEMFGGSWMWIIVILLLFAGNGNWGNNGFYDVARESTLNTQFVERDIQAVNSNVLENRYANQLAECDTRKDVLLGNANLQKDILLGNQNLASSMASCCCEIKNAIRDDGEATRALIASIDRERLQYELNQANTAVANAVQTQNILNSLGQFYPKAGVNPCAVYNYGAYGTTIA